MEYNEVLISQFYSSNWTDTIKLCSTKNEALCTKNAELRERKAFLFVLLFSLENCTPRRRYVCNKVPSRGSKFWCPELRKTLSYYKRSLHTFIEHFSYWSSFIDNLPVLTDFLFHQQWHKFIKKYMQYAEMSCDE